MVAIFQTTFSNGFSWMKMYEFRLTFHWSLFLRVKSTIFPALVQIMAWRRSGDKPLSEPMMVSLLTHICVTRPQWVNINKQTRINMWILISERKHQYKPVTNWMTPHVQTEISNITSNFEHIKRVKLTNNFWIHMWQEKNHNFFDIWLYRNYSGWGNMCHGIGHPNLTAHCF